MQRGPAGGPRLVVRALGPLLIQDRAGDPLGPRDLGGARPKQVLEILLAARGHNVPVDRLVELLWEEAPPGNAAGSLHTFVSVLRRHLVDDRTLARQLVVTEPEAYRFDTERVMFDLDRFDELLEASARQPTRAARDSLETALRLVRGDAFEDEPYATWAADVRGSYEGRILGARLDAADLALAEGDHAPALVHAEAAAALDRFSERARRCEMLALYALGRGHEALERYRSFRSRLDDELGLEPNLDTRELETAILRQVDVATLLPRRITHPMPERDRDAPALLGRRGELDELAGSVARGLAREVALIELEGPAGIGKTRLLDELQRDLPGIRVGRAGASELEAHLPYVPLAAALRDALADVALCEVASPALAAVLPELTLAGTKTGAPEVEVLEALVALVAQHAPIVLLIDDLQWADPQTVAALAYLRRRGHGTACAIVTATRGGVHRMRRLRPDALIRLEPLSAEDLEPLGLPELHSWTGGIPRLVVEEIGSGRRPHPSPSLVEALLERCRAEGEQAFRVLVVASLLEQPFEPEPLADLLHADATGLTEELERLCEQRILRIDGNGFRFRHEVCRRVLLGSMSPARQRLLQERL